MNHFHGQRCGHTTFISSYVFFFFPLRPVLHPFQKYSKNTWSPLFPWTQAKLPAWISMFFFQRMNGTWTNPPDFSHSRDDISFHMCSSSSRFYFIIYYYHYYYFFYHLLKLLTLMCKVSANQYTSHKPSSNQSRYGSVYDLLWRIKHTAGRIYRRIQELYFGTALIQFLWDYDFTPFYMKV